MRILREGHVIEEMDSRPAATCEPHVCRCHACCCYLSGRQLQSEHKAPSPLTTRVGSWPQAAVEGCCDSAAVRGKQTLGELPENDAHDPSLPSPVNFCCDAQWARHSTMQFGALAGPDGLRALHSARSRPRLRPCLGWDCETEARRSRRLGEADSESPGGPTGWSYALSHCFVRIRFLRIRYRHAVTSTCTATNKQRTNASGWQRIVMARARSRRDAPHRVRQPDIVKVQ
jgi:hypothetical protein